MNNQNENIFKKEVASDISKHKTDNIKSAGGQVTFGAFTGLY